MSQFEITLPWSNGRKIAFRFGFIFFILYALLQHNEILPEPTRDQIFYMQPMIHLVQWIGAVFFHISHNIGPDPGSGDTSFDFLLFIPMILFTIIGTAIWTIFDNKRRNYVTLHYWLIVFIRYFIALALISFGLAKVYGLQFGAPTPGRLIQPLGQSSPMGLAWTFYGYSAPYNIILGCVELLCACLLLFKRTMRLAVIVTLITTVNVMAVNYFFDICVKLFSTALVILSIYLLLQQRKQHAAFFIFNRTVPADRPTQSGVLKKWGSPASLVFKLLIVGALVIDITVYANGFFDDYGRNSIKPPLYGIYDIETFVKNNDTLAALTTDTVRWRKLVISRRGSASIRSMKNNATGYSCNVDTVQHQMVITSRTDTTLKSHFTYFTAEKDKLVLSGKWLNDSVTIVMHKYDLDKFPLKSRRIHLINERPFSY